MFIGVDCGTRETNALAVDDCRRARGGGYPGYRLSERDRGAREQHPTTGVLAMVAPLCVALNGSALPAGDVHCIGAAHQRHGLSAVDAAGTATRQPSLATIRKPRPPSNGSSPPSANRELGSRRPTPSPLARRRSKQRSSPRSLNWWDANSTPASSA